MPNLLKLQAEAEANSGVEAAAQVLYFAQNGKYRQTIKHDNEIADESYGIPVDEYVGPLGKGYIERLTVKKGGKTYVKLIDHGPEQRSKDWFEAKITS